MMLLSLLSSVVLPIQAQASDPFAIDIILPSDGTFMGRILTGTLVNGETDSLSYCNLSSANCIFNESSRYSQTFATDSVFNARFATPYGNQSVCNEEANPMLVPTLFIVLEHQVIFFDSLQFPQTDLGIFLNQVICGS